MTRLLTLAVALLIVLAGCSTAARPRPVDPSPTPLAPPYTVEVDGRTVRVQTGGLDGRQPDAPVVVFEHGAGETLATWADLLPAVAGFAPVVAYDRAGLGGSDAADDVALAATAGRLFRLLDVLDVDGPVVLVGHSWGGAHVRYAAGLRPDRVAGAVYLDPTDAELTRDEDRAVFVAAGLGEMAEPAYQTFRAGTLAYIAQAPPGARRELEAMEALHGTPVEARALPPHPEVPVAVVLAARPTPPPPGFPPDAYRAWERTYADLRADRFGRLVRSSPDGTLVVATALGHDVHRDDPALVVEVVRRVLR